MKLKKFLASLLPIFLIFVFTACGCKHEWSEATCLNPKTCNLCGVTEGEPIEHSYMDANCDNPKRCSFCDATEGKALGHNYVDGYCTKCYIKDPNYIDLNIFGFTNMYGMNVWLEVSGYDFGNNRVFAIASLESPAFDFKAFYGNYFKRGWIRKNDLVSASTVTVNLFGSSSTTVYNVISNDVITYDSGAGIEPATIEKRVVDSKNSKLVMKTIHEDWYSDEEYWYVPADLLDFSTIKLYEKNENNPGYSKYSINFK